MKPQLKKRGKNWEKTPLAAYKLKGNWIILQIYTWYWIHIGTNVKQKVYSEEYELRRKLILVIRTANLEVLEIFKCFMKKPDS